jgi:hypothetical protein
MLHRGLLKLPRKITTSRNQDQAYADEKEKKYRSSSINIYIANTLSRLHAIKKYTKIQERYARAITPAAPPPGDAATRIHRE